MIFFIAVKILSHEDSLAIWHQDGAYGLTLYFSNLRLDKIENASWDLATFKIHLPCFAQFEYMQLLEKYLALH